MVLGTKLVLERSDTTDCIAKILEQFRLLLVERPLLSLELGFGYAVKCKNVLEIVVQYFQKLLAIRSMKEGLILAFFIISVRKTCTLFIEGIITLDCEDIPKAIDLAHVEDFKVNFNCFGGYKCVARQFLFKDVIGAKPAHLL